MSDKVPVFDYKEKDFDNGTAFAEYHAKYFGTADYDTRMPGFIKLAKSFGIDDKQVKAAMKALLRKEIDGSNQMKDNRVDFDGFDLDLRCREWDASDTGIYRDTVNGKECACSSPVAVSAELVNIDTEDHKVQIAFRDNRSMQWRKIICPMDNIATTGKIVMLSNKGLPVTQKNAAALIDYLHCLRINNPDQIPEIMSTARMGYIPKYDSFAPYSDNIVFDGDESFRSLYQSVQPHGDMNTWVECARQCRKESVEARIILAASFASVINYRLGLPFFVHLWSENSGNGKTVLLRLAASVWGNPSEHGGYIKTFDSTAVGQERTAACLNQLPLCLDELQLAKDKQGRSTFGVYKLAEGIGRTRGEKTGGVDTVLTWSSCILTTGESEIVTESDGAGAYNRSIQLHCDTDCLLSDMTGVYRTVCDNYGLAGKRFVEILYSDQRYLAMAENLHAEFRKDMEQTATGKQALSAATLLTADSLVNNWLFGNDDFGLTMADIRQYLLSAEDVSIGLRGYTYILDWIESNKMMHLYSESTINGQTVSNAPKQDTYGRIVGNVAYFIPAMLKQVLRDQGYDAAAVLSWMRKHDKMILNPDNKKNPAQKQVKVDGQKYIYCYAVKLPTEDEAQH